MSYVDTRNFTNVHCCDPRTDYPRDHDFCAYNNVSEILQSIGSRSSSSTTGFGKYSAHFQGTTTHLAWMQGDGCDRMCRRKFSDHYVWQSPNLPTVWNATEFCHRLGPDRRIAAWWEIPLWHKRQPHS
jgi:hypothetical protein